MREYGKILTRFWTSPDILGLAPEPKCLAAYLLSSPHSNMIGCFRLPLEYAAADLNWQRDVLTRCIEELEGGGFVRYDARTSWLIIHRYLKWNPLENWNVGKAAAKLITGVPRTSAVYEPLIDALVEHNVAFLPKGFVDGLRTVTPRVTQPLPQPLPNQEPEPIQEPEPEQEPQPSAPRQAALLASPVVIGLQLESGDEYEVTQAQANELQELYPAADVPQELRNMRGWLIANPARRKTRKRIMQFITGWLSKEKDAPRQATPVQAPAPVSVKPAVPLPADLNKSAGRAWDEVIKKIKPGIDRHSFEMWLAPCRGLGVSKGVLYVSIPSDDFSIIEEKWTEQIAAAVEGLGLSKIKLVTGA